MKLARHESSSLRGTGTPEMNVSSTGSTGASTVTVGSLNENRTRALRDCEAELTVVRGTQAKGITKFSARRGEPAAATIAWGLNWIEKVAVLAFSAKATDVTPIV